MCINCVKLPANIADAFDSHSLLDIGTPVEYAQ